MVDKNEKQLGELWGEFLAQKPTKDDLIHAVRIVPHLRMRAWQLLMSGDAPGGLPTDRELVSLMQEVGELYHTIRQELIERNPGIEELTVP
ncbi:MAG: hypothetical protein KJI72_03045 [Patescibacteria group bacterium]|nr:hypothetical protein [Patescibacteria group bacterium]